MRKYPKIEKIFALLQDENYDYLLRNGCIVKIKKNLGTIRANILSATNLLISRIRPVCGRGYQDNIETIL